ncbi:hydrolase [Halogeometricum pallidum JCM 14848]|uniref:Hydrolase n=1 Tax=Halogeometricum pallidum JCM 14848 TaxID=1227487 RepID=M0CWP5_HALPD|nr:hydrolase [Halogeometricum pallidum JCM 14848]
MRASRSYCCTEGWPPPEYWNPTVPHFPDRTSIVPQRPGFGTCLDSSAETPAEAVLERELAYVRALATDLEETPVLFGHSYGALTAIEAAKEIDAEAVIAYEPAVLPEEYRRHANLADRMEQLIERGDRRAAVKRYIEHVLHPGGIDDLDAWLATWPPWPDCVDLAEEVVRMNRAVEQYQCPTRFDVNVPVFVLSGTGGPDFLRESARAVHDALPHSWFSEFDTISHSGPAEAPELISSTAQLFLREVRNETLEHRTARTNLGR